MGIGMIFVVSLITATDFTDSANAPFYGGRIYDLIKGLGWNNLAMLLHCRNGCGDLATEVLRASGRGIQVCVYDLNTTNINTVLQDIYDIQFPDIHVIAAVDEGPMQYLLSTADKFDLKSKRMTDFRHHSQWLLLVENLSSPDPVDNLENVAMIRYSQGVVREAVTLTHRSARSTFDQLSGCDTVTAVRCYFPNTAYGYNNRRLLVAMLQSPPYVYKKLSEGKAVYSGYALDILTEIAKVLNFSVVEPPEGAWGLPVNRTYNGIVGMLHRREVDLAACDLTVDEDRAKYMDYIYPSINTQFTDAVYMTRGPEPGSSLLLLARPFKHTVYVVLFGIAFVIPVLLVLIGSSLNTLWRYGSTDMDTHDARKWTCGHHIYHQTVEAGLEVIGALFKQSTTKIPETMSGKVLFSSWLMLILVVTSVYCANLVASMSIHDESSLFSSLEDVVASDYSVGMRISGLSHTILKKGLHSTIQQKLWVKILANDPATLSISTDQHMERVKQTKYVFLLYRVLVDQYLAEDCQLAAIGERITWEQLSFGVARKSFLKPDMERVMSQLRESGLLDLWWKKRQKKRNMTKCANKRRLEPISLHHVGGGFMVVGVGAALSAAVLCVEILHHAVCRRHMGQDGVPKE